MAFSDLLFSKHPNWDDGVQAKVFFANGYGASVIMSHYSYGGDSGLYELGVFKGDEGDHELCYDTPVTSDVEGHLSPDDVTRLLAEIEALPPLSGQALETV